MFRLTSATLAICAAAIAAPAAAQGQTGRTSLLPYTQNGYVGLNIGRPEYKLGCGAGAFACDDPDASVHAYTGGFINAYFGLEAGYLHLGRADRQGGKTRGHGLNVSAIGQLPIGDLFRVFGKVGPTYGRTEISTDPLSVEPNGSESGFGVSYGIGVGIDFNNAWGAVLQWDRHEMKFAGRGREDIDNASVGVVFRF